MDPEDADDFYYVGGTLRPDSPSYVKRPADDDLYEAALSGNYCYVLTPRQMGKSSLMVRTARRLDARGVRTVILDLTSIGTGVTSDQWYLGLLSRVAGRVDRGFDFHGWWAEREMLGPVQRFTDYLEDVLARRPELRLVIFVDEIDTTLNLSFSDDFFAAVRSFYNARAENADLKRLNFVLLGVATPADLIKDRGRTPFNVGHRVELKEFDAGSAQLLAAGLEAVYPSRGGDLLGRILYWTGGHPYLTQKLCLAAVEAAPEGGTPEAIDNLVETLFLSEEARRETNLQFIRDNIKGMDEAEQRELLALYERVWRGERVPEDERSYVQNRLKLIGLVRVEGGTLLPRNEIYRRVFDRTWIRQAKPDDRYRRVAIGAVAVALLAVIGAVGLVLWQRQQTERNFIANHAASFESGNTTARLVALAALYDHNAASAGRADELIAGLSDAERQALFRDSDLTGLEAEVGRVARAIVADLDNTSANNELLLRMAEALNQTGDANRYLGSQLTLLHGARESLNSGQWREALDDYTDLIDNFEPDIPALFLEKAIAGYQLDPQSAETVLKDIQRLSDGKLYEAFLAGTGRAAAPMQTTWQARAQAEIVRRPELFAVVLADTADYAALAEGLPSPTPAPTLPPTPVAEAVAAGDAATATPAVSDAPTAIVIRLGAPEGTLLYSGPGTVYEEVGALDGDEELEVLGQNPTGEWYNVRLTDGA
uniref:AAA-like domain-containing protein n=1 Tax=Promineifilum sp. TaxID=2664178 RepID=UPI0035AF7F30